MFVQNKYDFFSFDTASDGLYPSSDCPDLYHVSFQNDKPRVKALVYLVFVLDTIQTFAGIEAALKELVYGFTDVSLLDYIGPPWFFVPIVGGTSRLFSNLLEIVLFICYLHLYSHLHRTVLLCLSYIYNWSSLSRCGSCIRGDYPGTSHLSLSQVCIQGLKALSYFSSYTLACSGASRRRHSNCCRNVPCQKVQSFA